VRTQGVSLKVLVDLVVSVVSYVVTAGVISIDPALAAVISKALGALAGVLAPPNPVAYDADDIGPALRTQRGYALIEMAFALLVFLIVVLILLKVLDRV
jgi:hypothetical protein